MDRRICGDNEWKDRFHELGFEEHFSLIGRDWSSDHGRKVYIKCKSCGETFITYGFYEVIKGHSKHLLCKSCGIASDGDDVWERSPRCDEAMIYYTAGHSVKETAERFNVAESCINNSVKRRRLTNGKSFHGFHGVYGFIKENEKRSKEAEQRLSATLLYLGFDYLGGYETQQSKCKIRCRACGAEYERTGDFLRKGNVTCVECRKRETKERQAERKREAEVKKAERDLYRMTHPPKDAYAEQHERFLMRSGVCEICGKSYTVQEYVESCGIKFARDNGVCSKQCKDERKRRIIRESHKGRQDSHRHRAKKYGCDYDPGVTLKKLVARDGLECKICGQMCDWNDHSWSKYSGPLYPSIDHIVPMSKGGGHVWENVQVAHIICNSEKGGRLEVTDA